MTNRDYVGEISMACVWRFNVSKPSYTKDDIQHGMEARGYERDYKDNHEKHVSKFCSSEAVKGCEGCEIWLNMYYLNCCDTSVIYGMIRYTQKLKITYMEQLNVDELIQVASNVMSNLKGGLP